MTESDDADRTYVRLANAVPGVAADDEVVHVLRLQPPAGATMGSLPALRLARGSTVIGRQEGSGLVLTGGDVSRRHCRLDLVGDAMLAGGAVMATDLDSTNGTFVDGVRIGGTVPLLPGARLRIGTHVLVYERRGRRELDEAEELEHELRRANQYILAILPLPQRAGPVLAEWFFQPCTSIGGDAFGYRDLGGGVHVGYMLDVAGHGVGAAMHAVSVANLLRQDGIPGVDPRDPAAVLTRLNEGFPMERHDGAFFTAFYWVYHTASRRLEFASAGHHPAYLLAPGQPEPVALWTRNPAVGMFDRQNFETGRTTLPPESSMCLFSDGAFEIEQADGRRWTIADFLAVLAATPLPLQDQPQRLYEAVRAAARPGPLEDDCSIVMIGFP